MTIKGAQQTITSAVTQWANVEAHPHRFGGTEYRIGQREVGHIHGDTMVDIPFPTKIRQELVETGRAEPHHLLPDSGWISFYIRHPADVPKAIDLLRLSYDLAMKQKARSQAE